MSATLTSVLPQNIFETVFKNSPGSLLIMADLPRFTILAASDDYLEITSSVREEVVGRGFFEVFPDEDVDEDVRISARSQFTKVVNTRQKSDVPAYRYDMFNPETNKYTEHYWSCSNTPIFGTDNEVAYILNTVVDITEEVRAKEAAIESESRLRLAAEATSLATWDLNLEDQSFIYSPRLVEIFGHPVDRAITLDDVRKQVNPDDMLNIVLTSYHESLKTGNYLYEVRIYWPDKSLHWIKTQGIVLKDEKKQPVRMLGTILDITESKRDEIRKNDFIAMASHELKTPLTSIKAYLQLLTKKLANSEDDFTHTALLKANIQVNKMTNLIHGFLDLSKLEPGKFHLKLKDFDINKLIEDSIAEINHTGHDHIIEFERVKRLTVQADREKIGQVINNFLSNAIKYSDKGSKVTVSCRRTKGYVKVLVSDEGIGIKPKEQSKLFQRFYRVENEKMKNISGFGIGLYLASEIIQGHKGKIGVKSEEGKGATFYFILPLAA
ncbi:MAG TPA: ATP-binding protein [Mucilaginibacter sp.]